MADIYHSFPITASAPKVFEGMTTPQGLDAWWTLRAAGHPAEGAEYALYFGEKYDWRAVVTRSVPGREFELRMTRSGPDWAGTRVGFQLIDKNGFVQVRFHHLGWPEANEHFRTSSYCWAMYLRLLRRYVESGELVPYERRLDACSGTARRS